MRLKFLINLNLFLTIGITFLSSCKEFIEPSITKKSIQLNAPANNYQTEKYALNFWWDELEDALKYRLQIVTPTFDAANVLVMDTLVELNKFTVTLEPGDYQWRVRAENGSTQTPYSDARAFTIQQSSLALQKVTLSSPLNNTLNNQNSISFKWISLYGATGYRIQVDTNGFANEAAMVLDKTTPATQWTFIFPKDREYQWRVQAVNATEESIWSDVYSINHDRTPPAVVPLIFPDNNAQIAPPFTFRWTAVNDARKYKLYVFKSNGTTLYSQEYPKELTTTSFEFKIGTSGEKIQWKVSALDAAGNEGAASETRTVTLQ